MQLSNHSAPPPRLDAYGRRRIVQVLATLAIAVAVYCIAAGRLDVVWIWVYTAIGLITMFFGALYVLRLSPEAINERGRPPEKQPRWDKILLAIYAPFTIGSYIIAGLDARFGWSNLPLWLHLLGALLTTFGASLTYYAMAHNKFLSMYVQVSQERGHQVATGGPYRFVRHPMYVSLIFTWPALGFLFGSWPALLCGLIAALMIVIRTALEDRALQAGLPGYTDYARQVRYRLIPGVW